MCVIRVCMCVHERLRVRLGLDQCEYMRAATYFFVAEVRYFKKKKLDISVRICEKQHILVAKVRYFSTKLYVCVSEYVCAS